MYDDILFPTDGSDGAADTFDHVLDIAATHDATVHILFVTDTTQTSATRIRSELLDTLEAEGEEIVAETAARAEQRDVSTVTEVVQGEPYREIVEYADSREIDLVVMPTHGRQGLERFLLGSTTERVVRQANVPVLTIQPDDDRTIEYPYRNVLVPTDGSECANQALALGTDVATTHGAALHLLSVVAVTSLGVDVRSEVRTTALEERANDLIEDAEGFATNAGVDSVSTTVGYGASIHRAILSYLDDHDIDLVVMGTHGRTGFDRYVLGSVTEYLVRTSPIPVLTVREPISEV
ncbi:universal stress protein [Halobacteriaceae archaeon SHR40]|uniref:universal stress protein n=1 Tax=Halovenus amylolytica TaxID=2500550 RepID=UPI000FE43C7D